MSLSLPLHTSSSQRNRDSRSYYTSQTRSPTSAEGKSINGAAKMGVKEKKPKSKERIVVGVDFGTTFSG